MAFAAIAIGKAFEIATDPQGRADRFRWHTEECFNLPDIIVAGCSLTIG